jgi:hypothetical protein
VEVVSSVVVTLWRLEQRKRHNHRVGSDRSAASIGVLDCGAASIELID